MLRILLSNTQISSNISKCLQHVNRFNNFKNKISTLIPKPKTIKNIQKFSICGAGFSVGVLFKYSNIYVRCEAAQHFVDVKAVTLRKRESKFDWRKFWEYLKPHLIKFIAAIIAALAVAYFNIQIPNLLGHLVNSLTKYIIKYEKSSPPLYSDIQTPAFKLLSMYILQSACTFMYIFLLSEIGEQIAVKMRQDLFKQFIIQEMNFFDENRTGELVNRLTTDVQDFKSSFKMCISQGLRSITQLLGGTISLFIISPHLATIAVISVPAAVLVGSLFGQALRQLSKKSQEKFETATIVCEEALGNIRTVRANASESMEIAIFEQETNNAALLAQKLGLGIAVFQASVNFLINCMVLTTLYLGGHLISTDSLTAGQLMAFLVASQNVQRSLSQGSILIGTLIRGMTAGSRVFECLAIQPSIDLYNGIEIPNNMLKGKITFENVTFYYPSRRNQVILKDFNLTLNPGQTIALVGVSGSGKSTVAGLLERFYEPNYGKITIDGYELNEISPVWLHSKLIGLIEQQPILFATNILENIRYSKPDATDEEIYEAAKLSQAHDFIVNLPEKYETNVGERGIQLSGGQRQRIAIARALLKKPTILILDEATSALDASSESEVQKALETAVKDHTTLVIAHRLSTIQNADVIVVLDNGKIIEMGSHQQLIKKKGAYFNLVRQQENEDKQQQQES